MAPCNMGKCGVLDRASAFAGGKMTSGAEKRLLPRPCRANL